MDLFIDLDAIHALVRSEMKRKNVTAIQLSDMTGIARTTIDNYLIGKTKVPAFDRLCLILVALECSIDNVIGNPNIKENALNEDCEKKLEKLKIRLEEEHNREIARIEQYQSDRIESKEKIIAAKDEHIASLSRSRNTMCIFCGILLCLFAFWFIWDITHPANGIIRYSRSLGFIGNLIKGVG